MRVDVGNALADVATPGVPRSALDRLDERVAAAHARVQRERERGAFGYAALDLPEVVEAAAIRETVSEFDAEMVLTVGIGGSALPAATVSRALDDVGPADAGLSVLDNVDPDELDRTLDELDLAETVVNVVSKSGTTPETLANFLAVRAAMDDAGVDWTERTLVTTGDDGPLSRLAERQGLPTLDVPADVPGRFAALSPVGLAAAAIQGRDVEAVLAGARDAADALSDSLYECPAYAYAATAHALTRRGVRATVMMPYAESLAPFSEWFGQLWAESLGKDGLGQTPVRAVGATDQHSRLQLLRAGPREHLVTVLRPVERGDRAIPADPLGDGHYLAETSMRDLLDAELRATEGSLAAAGRPSVRIEVDRVDERGVGELLYGMQAACVMAGELSGVETFTQPAVEWGKRATRGLLGDSEGQTEAEAVAAKRRFVVEPPDRERSLPGPDRE